MEFIWDEKKRKTTIRERGLDFADAEVVFSGATFTFEDGRFDYAEQRFITMGLLRGIVVVIAHTERGEAIRVISMRKATKHEQETYFQNISN
jgi:uncharacterized DUF497 family protein